MATIPADDTNTESKKDKKRPSTIVVDMGKKKRKLIRRLRKGRGKLMRDVNDLVDEMRDSGQLADDVQPLVIVVRQKRRKSKMFPF